eukprot:TRINITY_DN18326_c0_g1_i1.p1 TRINITY_DN18326_c0_g1~~TRINITY_DN18326_c0_g1_i1.p1  ORF type:complete len:346 (+),score=68.56 TRINITY_DN18326_c0_g1_i1:83-1120(+)
MAPGPGLPPHVLSHPLLERLSPELRERVLLQLQGIATRQSGRGEPVDRAAAAAGDGPPPPPNHRHVTSQTTFPTDAAMQTDPLPPDPAYQGAAPPDAAAACGAAHGNSYAWDSQRRAAAHSPGAPPAAHLPAAPLSVGSHADAVGGARRMLEGHPSARAIRGEAHARLLAERLLAEHNRNNPPPLEPLYSEAAALGFPVPGASPPHHQPPAPGSLEQVQKTVRDEFWRHFNAEFDRAVLLARDGDADSLLQGGSAGADLAADSPGAGFYSAAPDDARARDETRAQVQGLFWDHYVKSLDAVIHPEPSIDYLAAVGEAEALAAAAAPPFQGHLRSSAPGRRRGDVL